METHIIAEIRRTLTENSDPKVLALSSHFFKKGEEGKVHGVRMVETGRIGKSYLPQIKELSKAEVFRLCEELWKSGYVEEATIACIWSESLHEQYEPADFELFEHWVKTYLTNWADCDTLCNHTIGMFVMQYPRYIDRLKEWATSSERWVKRAAAVTLIIPARKGLFLDDIFHIADTLLLDKDHMVQKGYGWMLKAASQSNEKLIFDYVMARKATMPRTALRYAIEKMPKELKALAMAK